MITVVGMGRKADDLTLAGAEAIRAADVVVVKSALTHAAEAVDKIRQDAVYCDDLYQSAQNFDQLNEQIVRRLRSYKGKVAFCVVGDGRDDTTAAMLDDAATVCGVGLQTAVMPQQAGARIYTAAEFCEEKYPLPLPTVIKSIDDKYTASAVQLKLSEAFDYDTPMLFCSGGKVKNITLGELCKQRFGYAATAAIAPKPLTERAVFGYYDAAEVLSVLRGENGCPWDRAQTHESIRINLIEEAYELIDAIDRNDLGGMVEETGDVLLQAVFHAMIGNADGEYNFNDVVSGLCHKLITRHTHIFGHNKATNAEDALDYWNAAKAVEKEYTSFGDKMDKIPKNLPALLYAYKIQKVAVKCGFDWPDIDGTYDKLNEEIREFKEADGDDAVMEAGDLLFSAINPMRWRHIEPETALKEACDKFVKRFKYMESEILKDGKDLGNAEILDKYWNKAKKIYK